MSSKVVFVDPFFDVDADFFVSEFDLGGEGFGFAAFLLVFFFAGATTSAGGIFAAEALRDRSFIVTRRSGESIEWVMWSLLGVNIKQTSTEP